MQQQDMLRPSAARRRARTRTKTLSTRLLAAVTALVALGGAQAGNVLQQKLRGLPSGLAYYVEVRIGSPLYSSASESSSSNSFNLLVDTGSANTAVATADCCSLTNKNLYSCADSDSCKPQDQSVSVSYVSGSWSGVVVEDIFSGQGLGTVASMPFAEITTQDSFISPGAGYDGIIGLAFRAIASPSGSPPMPYFDTVATAKNLDDTFSMLLCGALQALRLENVMTEDDSYLYAGELLLGGTLGAQGETYYSGDLVYTPLVQDKYYSVVVTDIGVGGESLGVDCEAINSPRAIIDSGTSNLAFPSSIYSAVISELKTQVKSVVDNVSDSFFDDSTACCSQACDPTNADSVIYSLPGLSISLAMDGQDAQQVTVTIPAEYIWRPITLSSGMGEATCRVFGISEGDFTLLGDVFMDGLFTVHDRKKGRVGLALADKCPNGVTSSKKVTVETLANDEDSSFCHCVGSSDRKSSLLASYVPFSSKPCFFWQWWMYVVIVALVVIILAAAVYAYVWWKRRKLLRQLAELQTQNQNEPRVQQSLDTDNRLDRNLLSSGPTSSVHSVETHTPPAVAALGNSSGDSTANDYRLAESPPRVRFNLDTTSTPATASPGHKTANRA